jgi:hypothetical protein
MQLSCRMFRQVVCLLHRHDEAVRNSETPVNFSQTTRSIIAKEAIFRTIMRHKISLKTLCWEWHYKFRECLLPFGSESFVIPPAVQECKGQNIQNHNSISCLYGCETWSLTLREEHRLRVFENRILRRIFGRKRDEMTAEWRKLHTEELHNLYSSPDIIR